MTLQQCWKLATEWYADRLNPRWRPKTVEEAEVALAKIGLRGNFWKLKS